MTDFFYGKRWEFSREKTPESVASQFSLVCANDYQRSLSKVINDHALDGYDAFHDDDDDIFHPMPIFHYKQPGHYCSIAVSLHGRQNGWCPGLRTSLRQVRNINILIIILKIVLVILIF